ncbi:MAG: CHAT domain-containing protein, partial [Nitrospinota bacterium]|nr:CHAT domain-containing protein [Nitrospinota bacterium]
GLPAAGTGGHRTTAAEHPHTFGYRGAETNLKSGTTLGGRSVALTACETGVGKQVAGEGVMGMGRAFQYAGAKSVLVSLWSVAEASTTLLVERFFSHLKNGADKVSALRQAREDVIRAGYRHPFFWSPFILIGGGDKPRTEARPATVQRTPERVARAETPRTRDCPAVASRGIISHFVRVKTMGIGGTREGKFT